jgi:hypothetical protein
LKKLPELPELGNLKKATENPTEEKGFGIDDDDGG